MNRKTSDTTHGAIPPPSLAKLTRPRLFAPVRRHRLIALLDRLRQHPAIWISAPPGSGKTTLVADYLDHHGIKEIWYQCDEGDSDLPTFFFYIGRAMDQLPELSTSLPVFSAEYLANIWAFARRFFQELFALLPRDSVLVFDNLNSIREDSLLWPLLETAIAQIPGALNLIFVSRARPPMLFSRAIASQHLCELTWDDIRFTEDESVSFAATTKNPSETARAIHREMGGWIAGMVLTLANRDNRQPNQVVTTEDSMPRIFEYFASEVFERMPESTRIVLMKTSLLSEVTVSMAEELCDVAGTEEVLQRLSRLQFFVDRRMASETSFRFHDLFRAFLQHRLVTELSQPERNAVQVRAAQVLERRGSYDEAVALYIAAGDIRSVARLVQENAASLISQGRYQTVRSHIESLPKEYVDESPWLLYWLGHATMQTDLAGAMALHTKSYERFKEIDDKNGLMLSCASLINQIYFDYDDFTRMGPWMHALHNIVRDSEWHATPSIEIAALDALLKGAMFYMPRFSSTQDIILRLENLLDGDVDINQRMSAFISLLTYASLVADFKLGDKLIVRLADSLSDPRLTPLNRAYWWLFVGYYMHVKMDSVQCSAAFDRSDAIAKEYGLKQTEMLSANFRSYETQVSGNYAGAKAALDLLRTLIDPARAMDRAQLHLSSTLFYLMRIEGHGAAQHARLAMEAAHKLGSPFFRDHWMWYCAAGLAANDELDEAEDWLNQSIAHAAGTYNERSLSGMLTVLAFIAIRRGDSALASSRIEQMVRTVRLHGTETFVRMTLGLKDVVMRAAFHMGIERTSVREMIQSLGVPAEPEATEEWPWRLRIYTLGPFRVVRDDVQLNWTRKTPKKPLKLLKALIAYGGQRVPVTKLQDALWPNQEGDLAGSAFDVTLHRLRKLIGIPGVLEYVDGTLSIDSRYVWIDVWRFLQMSGVGFVPTAIGECRKLYCGEFLVEDVDEPWAAPMRDRVRRRLGYLLQSDGDT